MNEVSVIYVVGAGRSGSTVLDTVLGNHAQIVSVGELSNGPRAWSNVDQSCACGAIADDCDFWNHVRQEWEALTPDLPKGDDWIELQNSFERIRSLRDTMRQGREQSERFKQYATGILALYKAILKVSGKAIVLDSSKNPARAIALSYVAGLNLRVLHLVRDGRGVAWSFKKSFSKDPNKGIEKDMSGKPLMRTIRYWLAVNIISEFATSMEGVLASAFVNYEQFVLTPAMMFKKLGDSFDMNFDELVHALDTESDFHVGHTIAGNRLRMEGKIKLNPDFVWKEKLSGTEKMIFWLCAGLLAKRYGYSYSGFSG